MYTLYGNITLFIRECLVDLTVFYLHLVMIWPEILNLFFLVWFYRLLNSMILPNIINYNLLYTGIKSMLFTKEEDLTDLGKKLSSTVHIIRRIMFISNTETVKAKHFALFESHFRCWISLSGAKRAGNITSILVPVL